MARFVASAPRNDGLATSCDIFNTSGKSVPIFGNHVKPRNQKYSAFHFGKSELQLCHPGPHEGRFAIVTKRRAGVVMDALASAVSAPDENAEAYGQVVWSWRRDAGVKSAGAIPLATVTTSPLHRGEHEVSRKAIAQGMSECSPLTCMLVCAISCAILGTRDRGCSAHPAFPAPSISREGQRICKPRAKTRRENGHACFHVIASEAKQSTLSAAALWIASSQALLAMTAVGVASLLAMGQRKKNDG